MKVNSVEAIIVNDSFKVKLIFSYELKKIGYFSRLDNY